MGAILSLLGSYGLDKLSEFISKGGEEAKKIIKDKTGIDLNLNDISKDDIEKLKAFQQQNEDLIDMMLKDKQNAREMQIQALKQNGWFAKNFIHLFAMFWSIIASVYIFAIIFMDYPIKNQRIADTITGILIGTIIVSIVSFYFGSSLGSKNKEERLLNDK